MLVVELVTAGFFGDAISETFRREGRAMLEAVSADLRQLRGVQVRSLSGTAATLRDQVRHDPAETKLIIAPEFDGLLETFCAAAHHSGTRSLNCSAAAISLTADKWMLAQHLDRLGLPTIPTRLCPIIEPPNDYPCVIKPRDGAGSWLVRCLRGGDDFSAMQAAYRAAGRTEYLCQPLVRGRACSVAVLIAPNRPSEILPVAEQILSEDGEFRYLGGRLPASLSMETASRVQELMSRLMASIRGLNGYIGCDLIVTEQDEPTIVEINPRVTTSYLGYRGLCLDNLMERLLFPEIDHPPIRWSREPITFDPFQPEA